MTNEAIADNFSLLSKLMDIHGDDAFKAKSYASAAFTIDKLETELSTLDPQTIFSQRGIGATTGKKIIEQLETGRLEILEEYIQKTPAGILEMLRIKGIGPKKIATIWKELEIETLGELLYACEENRLTLYKGFGEKTQANIQAAIEFYVNAQGNFLYAQMEPVVELLQQKWAEHFNASSFLVTGAFRQQQEVITILEWVTDQALAPLESFFEENNFEIQSSTQGYLEVTSPENTTLGFHIVDTKNLVKSVFETSCAPSFFEKINELVPGGLVQSYTSEEEIFKAGNISYIPPYLREDATIIETASSKGLPTIIVPSDIKGIIHSHSKWSDGSNTLLDMATAAKAQGFEYLVISDHSKSAFYASGLQEDRIIAQHKEIDQINKPLAPYKIFKSIESDILNDGSLDYAPGILQSFDLIIASVHSNLKMQEEKAMQRLITAIENPYTNILGHMTGRLLLSRKGYPVDHQKIIDACAANNVVIELNAHPRRLDIDWRMIGKALNKGVLISINPDAHAVEGFEDCRYGVLVAQKAGVTKENNLSSYTLDAFEKWVATQQTKRK
jgi:DNA polymerase (family 10)